MNAGTERIEAFNRFLDEQLSWRGWSDYQLAKRARLTHAVISRARVGLLPKWEACKAIARALDLPAEVVFRKAGLLPAEVKEDAARDELNTLYEEASPAERDEILRYARYVVRDCK